MKKSFLFLQGPHGPFFRLLGHCLRGAGYNVRRINFNGGDLFDWSGPETLSFKEKADEWPDFLAEFIRKNTPTDLVSFGDCRPLLESGIQTARNAGMRCHVFEEGYIRPDWITLEANGVNGKSNFPKDPSWILEEADGLHEDSSFRTAGDTMRGMVYHVITYYLAKFAANPFFPNFRSHRPYSEWEETRCWAVKLARKKRWRARGDMEFQKEFLGSGKRFFLFCLQLGSDSQIHHHSPFGSMKKAINEVIISFANGVAEESVLLVKNHPLDPGIGDLEHFTLELAKELGIGGRVFFTEGGDLPVYIRAAAGVILVNSTAGMFSLHQGRPTITLGKAIYAVPGLVNSNGLDNFWSDPIPPDRKLYNAFRRVLIHRTQINGSFYTKEGIPLALPKAMDRLLQS